MKKFLAILLTALMVLALGTAALAEGTPEPEPTSGTITVTNPTIGQTYTLYKLFDASYSGNNISYTFTKEGDNDALYAALTANDSPFVLTPKAGSTTEYVVTIGEHGDPAAEYTDAEIITWLKALDLELLASRQVGDPITPTEANPEVVFEDLPFGYYFMTSSLGTVVTITNVAPDATVVDKNQIPTFDDEGKYMLINGEEVLINSANVGQIIEFGLPIDATNYVGDEMVIEYTVTDTMPDGITLLNETEHPITVSVNGVALDEDDYTLVINGNGFTLTIPWATLDNGEYTSIYEAANNLIEVTYYGVVNEQIADAEDGAVNRAEFDYTTDQGNHFPEGEKPHSETTTYSTGITLKKVDESGNKLTGAKFSIEGTSYGIAVVNEAIYVEATAEQIADPDVTKYYMLTDGSYTQTAPTEDTMYLYDSDTQYVLVEHVGTEFSATPLYAEGYVDGNGLLSFEGIGEGFYTITELEAPDGYNLLAAPIYVNVVFDEENESFSYYLANADGTNQLDDNDQPISFNPALFPIQNHSGSQLPETGGIGTKIFYIVGGLLMATAVVLLVTRKKMSATEE